MSTTGLRPLRTSEAQRCAVPHPVIFPYSSITKVVAEISSVENIDLHSQHPGSINGKKGELRSQTGF